MWFENTWPKNAQIEPIFLKLSTNSTMMIRFCHTNLNGWEPVLVTLFWYQDIMVTQYQPSATSFILSQTAFCTSSWYDLLCSLVSVIYDYCPINILFPDSKTNNFPFLPAFLHFFHVNNLQPGRSINNS